MAQDNWLKRYERAEKQRTAKAEQVLQYLCAFLRKLDVATVIVDFDGSGDSGEVSNAVVHPLPKAGLPLGMTESLREAMSEIIPGGWELDSGSLGKVVLDVATGVCGCDIDYRDDDEFDGEWE